MNQQDNILGTKHTSRARLLFALTYEMPEDLRKMFIIVLLLLLYLYYVQNSLISSDNIIAQL